MIYGTVYKTLDDIINREDKYDFHKICFYTVTSDGELLIPDTNLFQTYIRYIADYVGTYKTTDEQRRYYKYKPALLSNDIYGTPNLSWLLLMLNNRECASKFTIKQYIRLITPKQLSTLFDTIVTKSNDKLEANWNEYLPLVNQ